MPTYRVTKKSFLQLTDDSAPRLYKPGDIIEYDGPPGSGMELLDEAAMKRLDRARNRRREPAMSELPARVERIEDAVGQDVIQKAADKRAADEQAEREKAEAERKAAEEAAAEKRASERKAKDEAAKKAEADAAAKPAANPPAARRPTAGAGEAQTE